MLAMTVTWPTNVGGLKDGRKSKRPPGKRREVETLSAEAQQTRATAAKKAMAVIVCVNTARQMAGDDKG